MFDSLGRKTTVPGKWNPVAGAWDGEVMSMMSVRQQIIPMSNFAAAMLASDQDFARRVSKFERSFGKSDSDTLAVLAQACYFCWFEIEYEEDYSNVCRAIGTGKPTSLYLCRQISPQRWTAMNCCLTGVQHWLGVGPAVHQSAAANEWEQLLGDQSPEKEALAKLFVCKLAVDLLQHSFTKLSGANDPDEELYENFTNYYLRGDGSYYSLKNYPSLLADLKGDIRRKMNHAPEDAEELIAGILKESQPACQHRYARYQQIKMASIGALRWRGNLPADVKEPKYKARNWFEREADLSGWLNHRPAGTKVSAALHGTLGTPTEQKRAIVRDFFRTPPAGGFFTWLETRTKEDGTTVATIFGMDNH